MISHAHSLFAKRWMLVFILLPVLLIAGDPIPGIDITVDQTPGPTGSGKTNANGELILSGFKAGPAVVTLTHNGKTTVIGQNRNERINLKEKVNPAEPPVRIQLSRWWVNQKMSKGSLKANHNTTRSNRLAPAHVDTKGPGSKGKAKGRAQDHNTTRSNRATVARDLDVDSDDDSIPTTRAQDYNSSRSNTTSAVGKELDTDSDAIVEIHPMSGGRIKISVSKP